MDLIAILDTETTGLDPKTDECIEVAVVRYSLHHACMVDCFSMLIQADGNKAEGINHIPGSLLANQRASTHVWGLVRDWTNDCEAVLAHNADFDKQWVPDYFSLRPPWIDTCNGVDWPKQSKSKSSLVNLCLDHGLGVVDPHRALNDCLLLARLISVVIGTGHDIQAILARGLRPMALYQAMVSYDDKELAKVAGFRWEASTKRWLCKMAVEDTGALPFPVKEVLA